VAVFNKAALLSPPELNRRTFVTTTTGAEVRMRELSVAERLRALKRFKVTDESDPTQTMRSVLALVVISLCNEDDTPMFLDSEIEEGVDGLERHSSPEVEELMSFCQQIQGIAPDSADVAVKNSEASPSDTLSSGSRKTSGSLQAVV
jgi:hypothetical protein